MLNSIKSHFPNTRKKWREYFMLFYPMIIASTLFALNGFVDNFMVGQIEQGATALAAVNSWTSIIIGFYIGVCASASFIMARYYFSNQMDKAKELFKLRLVISLAIGVIFFIFAFIMPENLIKVFLKRPAEPKNLGAYLKALENSKSYLKVISFQWILIGITANMGNSFREIGFGKIPMYWGYGTIATNVIFNSIFMYGLNFGVEGAAWASLISRGVAISFGMYWLLIKKVEIRFNILTIFKIRKQVIKDFISKWYLFVSISSVILFVALRNVFYDAAYLAGQDVLGKGVGAMSVLALTGAIMSIFTTTFAATGSMAANVVAKPLSNGLTKFAYEEGKRLKGFLTLMSSIMSMLLMCLAFGIPYMTFLSQRKTENGILTFDNIANLLNVRNSLFVVCLFYPMWIWFIASYRIGCSGKKGFWFAFVDIIISGPIQLLWAAFLAYYVTPNSSFLQNNFWAFYAIFLSSDLLKLLFIELLFYKYKWNVPITKKEQKEIQAEMDDEVETAQIDMQ